MQIERLGLLEARMGFEPARQIENGQVIEDKERQKR